MSVDQFPIDCLIDSAVSPDDVLALEHGTAAPVETIRCSICGTPKAEADSLPVDYANPVCDTCDELAVNATNDDPWHGWPPGEKPNSDSDVIQMAPDRGENPVYILGAKCWRRYRFGGWVTRRDAFDCNTLEKFQDTHRRDGMWIHAFNTPQPDGVDVSRDECRELIDRRDRVQTCFENAQQYLDESDEGEPSIRPDTLRIQAEACGLSLPDSVPEPDGDPVAFGTEVKRAAREELYESPEFEALCERYYDN